MENLLSTAAYKRYIAYMAKKGEYNEMALIYVPSLLQDLKPTNIQHLYTKGVLRVSEGEIKPVVTSDGKRKIDAMVKEWHEWKRSGELPFWSMFDNYVDKLRTGGIEPIAKRDTAKILEYIDDFEKRFQLDKQSELKPGEKYLLVGNEGDPKQLAAYQEDETVGDHFKLVGVSTPIENQPLFFKEICSVSLLPPSDKIIEKTFKMLRERRQKKVARFIASLEAKGTDNTKLVEDSLLS